MFRIWGCAVVAIVLHFAALFPAIAQPGPFLGDSGASGLDPSNSSIMKIGNGLFDPNPSRTGTTEAPPISSARRGNGSAIVLYVTALELALAVLSAAAGCLVLVVAGIWVRIEDRQRSRTLQPVLRQQLALHPVRKISAVRSKTANS
ncbi:MAG TPA: hypothetical protein VKR60_01050 [Candidatus Sulfotelmatobacter sp.]|nr:hypothetical protein [Candidatus Sulfotelmatobacter sp.]